MGRLPVPVLDDRSYEQLREELIARIPVYAPEWTDHEDADPGIALLELFAFLTESLLHRSKTWPRSRRLWFAAGVGVGGVIVWLVKRAKEEAASDEDSSKDDEPE